MEWLVWSPNGARYTIRLRGVRITCTCPYFVDRGEYCKHIAAVCTTEIFRYETEDSS
ncbi:MAG: SWIM zinc finger family protein [Candidatus Bathyarchaeia archaeon]